MIRTIKKSLYISTLGFALLTSCERGLQEESYSVFDETTLTKPENALQAVIGVYSALRDNGGNGYYAGYIYQLYEYPADILTTTPTSRQGIQLDQLTYDASNSVINDVWVSIYRLIARANESEHLVSNIDFSANATTQQTQKQYLGEIRFLRALAYYDATALWGDVPLNLKSSSEFTEADENPSLVAQSVIEEQILTDLRYAEENLPETYSAAEAGRATRGAAKGLMARLYLRRGQFQEAADKCAEVMNTVFDLRSKAEGGLPEMFDNKNRSDNEFMFVLKSSSESGSYGILSNAFGIQSVPWDYNRGWGNLPIHLAFYGEFSATDDRKKLLLGTYKTLYGQIYTIPSEYGGDGTSIEGAVLASYTYNLKYPHVNNYNYAGYNNVSIIRYADVLMMRAEALNELNGPNTESITLLNQVLERSSVPAIALGDFATKAALRDFIFDERGREFFMEGRRREDLFRWGTNATAGASPLSKFKEKVQPRLRDQNTYSDAVNYLYYPYPLTEIQSNTSLDLSINDGRVRR
ncbi:RagB/SusD family nutrient uptake outer membrane protein [Sphingobacterium sp. LRF_L2]|uniref:RagB/SusD family nutrient uptake outer membrane protein n=1 Tax=Sphingobacterium sp. LRF_L2 TaxID=3369421 RepID=UPI003F5F73E6